MKNVLWTGGWDSTFRVLDLIFNKKENVQPYYIIDEHRPSTSIELRTMDDIRKMIKLKDKIAAQRLKKLKTVDKIDIKNDYEITNAYSRLTHLSHLGDNMIGLLDLLNKIISGIWNYAYIKMIPLKVL